MAMNKADNSNYGGLEFVQLTLRSDDKSEFDMWLSNNALQLEEMFDEILKRSYRITVKIDYNHRCFQTSVTQQDEKHMNYKKLMVTRAADVEEVIALTFYKISELLQWGEWPTQGDYSTWG